jgi:hypothetical protein
LATQDLAVEIYRHFIRTITLGASRHWVHQDMGLPQLEPIKCPIQPGAWLQTQPHTIQPPAVNHAGVRARVRARARAKPQSAQGATEVAESYGGKQFFLFPLFHTGRKNSRNNLFVNFK